MSGTVRPRELAASDRSTGTARSPIWAPPETSGRMPSLRGEVTGALGDLGTFVPLAIGLIVTCGLSTSTVLIGAGAMYALVAVVYQIPIPMQPMKAVTAIALANQLSPNVIATAALILGLCLLVLGRTGVLDQVAPLIPRWLVRGVQVAVGLALARVAITLIGDPPPGFDQPSPMLWTVPAAIAVLAICSWRPTMILTILGVGVAAVILTTPDFNGFGPSPFTLPSIRGTSLLDALTLLVLPQLPLSITSSCVATSDAAHTYYGPRAHRATPSRLATTIGIGNLMSAGIGAIPMCHGSGGVSAHHAFGARTWRAPAIIGAAMIFVGATLGPNLVGWAGAFPTPILAGLIGVVAIVHITLLRGLTRYEKTAAITFGGCGFYFGITPVLVAATVVLIGACAIRRTRTSDELTHSSN